MRNPKPYQVVWIKDEYKLLVSEQCLVKFKIGNYYDEVVCDIVPMDCCHILLGIPWQYDRQALHDGRLNQYTIWANGKRQVLLPLIEEPDENHCTIVQVYVVNGNQFMKDMKKENVCFVVTPSVPSNSSVD